MKFIHPLKLNETEITIKFTIVLIGIVMLVLFIIPCGILAQQVGVKGVIDKKGNLTYDVTLTIKNNTDDKITGATATLNLGEGLELTPGENPEKNIEDSGTGVETEISWKVRAINIKQSGDKREMEIEFKGVGLKTIEVIVEIPQPPLGLSPPRLPKITRGRLSGKLAPDPFPVSVTVRNVGKWSANNVKATLKLSKGLELKSGGNEDARNLEEIPPEGKVNQSWQVSAIDKPPYGQRSLTVKIQCKNEVKFDESYSVNIPPDGNIPPTITITTPAKEDVPLESPLTITWEEDDPDDDAQISLYYDTDQSGHDGTLIVPGLSEDADGSSGSYQWNTSELLPQADRYYVYAKIDDGHNPPVYSYGSGALICFVSHQLDIAFPLLEGKKTLILTINANKVTNLDTVHLTLNFDKEVLSIDIDDVTNGELNPEGKPSVNTNSDGITKIGMDLPGGKGVSGSGSIIQIKFKIIDEFQYLRSIQLLDLSLSDISGNQIPNSLVSFVLEIK